MVIIYSYLRKCKYSISYFIIFSWAYTDKPSKSSFWRNMNHSVILCTHPVIVVTPTSPSFINFVAKAFTFEKIQYTYTCLTNFTNDWSVAG